MRFASPGHHRPALLFPYAVDRMLVMDRTAPSFGHRLSRERGGEGEGEGEREREREN